MSRSNRKSRHTNKSRPSKLQTAKSVKARRPSTTPLTYGNLDPRINFSGLSNGQASGVFDLDLFEQNIQRSFFDNSAGFAYSINQNGTIAVRTGADGNARMEDNEPVKPFTPDTVTTIASVAKTITGTAILQLFQNQGQSVDSQIYPFLPLEWRTALDAPQRAAAKASIQTITFRELLTHESGIRVQDQNGDGNTDLTEQTSFAGLRQTILGGVNMNNKSTPDYQNANFALMRVMLPYIWNDVDNDELDNADDPATLTASYYVSYVRDNVLGPMGIEDADTKPAPEDDVRYYVFPDDGSDSIAWDDRTLFAGGEGWYLSVNELATFLAHLRYDDAILSDVVRSEMNSGLLGWRNPDIASYGRGMFGEYYSHGGALDNLRTGIMNFPNGVQIAIASNSQIEEQYMPHYAAYADNPPHQLLMVQRAFENAWPEITISGSSEPDTFEIRANAANTGAVDILLNGELVVTRWDETLEKITLNGVANNDTFIIGALPGTFEVVANGGAGNDEFQIDDALGANFGNGIVTVNGGSGQNVLSFDQFGGNAPDTYLISASAIAKSSRNAPINYSDIRNVHVYAGGANDTIRVNSTEPGTDVNVYGEGGNDTIRVGNLDLSVNINDSVWVDGGNGTNTLVLDDRNGGNALTNYVLQPTWFTQDGYSGLVHHVDIDNISLQTTNQSSNVNVRGTLPGQSLTILGRNGNDTVHLHATAATSTVSFLGGADNDTMLISPQDHDLDFLAGAIGFDGGTETDTLRLYDENDTGLDLVPPGNPYHDSYTVTTDGVLRGSAFADVTYLGTESVDLRANHFRNLVRVNGLLANTDLIVRSGGGDDDIVVGQSTWDLDSAILGDMAIYGGSGADLIHFRDAADSSGNDSYQIENTTFTKSGTDSWFYSQIESMILDANGFANTILVSGVGPLDLTLNGGAGNDTTNLGIARADLIQASMHVHGDAGSDRININAADTPGNIAYTFEGNTFDMSAATFGSLDHALIERLVLNAGVGHDVVDVVSSPETTAVELVMADGDDFIRIGAGHLQEVGGDVIASGGNGADTLVVNDRLHSEAAIYGINSTTVFKDGFSVAHNGFSRIQLRTGNANDQINVYASAPGTQTIILAGLGDDRVSLSPLAKNLGTIAGTIDFRGDEGIDVVVARDDNNPGGAATPYTVQSQSLNRVGFGGLTFTSIDRMRVIGGAGNDTFNVMSFNPDVVFALQGEAGNDTFNIWTGPEGSGTGGTVQIYGGTQLLAGPGDRLNAIHQNPQSVSHTKDPNVPKKGKIEAVYLDAIFSIEYEDIEVVV